MLPVFIVAVRSQEVALSSAAELLGARTSPIAVADGVGNSDQRRQATTDQHALPSLVPGKTNSTKSAPRGALIEHKTGH